MSSLVTQMIVAEKYGVRLDSKQLAELLSMTPGSVLNSISGGDFPIPTYKEGGRRFADYRDVAEYIDNCRPRAAA
ncbi:hypothetical protein EZI45_19195 [Delftia tsuruhatensis]|uniref:Helix-turn-helix domain-containing protein n=1 Tax=Delftia lacustris TaxID=558537 RepID=A0A7T2YMN7_9BURK|nr:MULTISPECIES: hypothetical protein [Delftia]QPS78582.1 hypothetical protein I6G47_16230 [Delftia lacustris]TDF26247.1 hypothetical protein EZI45_19195 [Delftia tsuruhatensis]